MRKKEVKMFEKIMQYIFVTVAVLCFVVAILAFATITYVGYDVFKHGTPVSCQASIAHVICFSRYFD